MNFLFLVLSCFFTFTLRAETAVYFTPSNACENNIIQLLNNAEQQIDIAVYSTEPDFYVAFQDGSDKSIITELGDETSVGVKAHVTTTGLAADESCTYVVYLAFFDAQDVLLDVAVKTEVVNENGSHNIETSLNKPENTDYVKAFVWDEDLKPYIDEAGQLK